MTDEDAMKELWARFVSMKDSELNPDSEESCYTCPFGGEEWIVKEPIPEELRKHYGGKEYWEHKAKRPLATSKACMGCFQEWERSKP